MDGIPKNALKPIAGKELKNGREVSSKSVFDYVGPTKLAINIVYLF